MNVKNDLKSGFMRRPAPSLVLSAWILFSSVPSHSETEDSPYEDLSYAQEVIRLLSSPDYNGRGYLEEGHIKAANYIAGEFVTKDLQKFKGDFFQKFSMKTNTFPGKVSLKINNIELLPFWDFVVSPCSPSSQKTYDQFYQAPWFKDAQKVMEDMQKMMEKDGKFQKEVIPFWLEVLKDQVKFDKATRKAAKGKVMIIDRSMINNDEQYVAFSESSFAKESWRSADYNIPTVILEISHYPQPYWSLGDNATEPCLIPKFVVWKSAFEQFETITSVSFDIESEFKGKDEEGKGKDIESRNVIGFIRGTQDPDSYIVLAAHYDHLGRMGSEIYFPGANDNASGVALLLYLASYFHDNPPKKSIAFIAFGGEELALKGSKHFVKNPFFPLKKIEFLLNFDIVGTGERGIGVVNALAKTKDGLVETEDFKQLKKVNKYEKGKKYFESILPRDAGRKDLGDHYPFAQKRKGIKHFYIYTRGGFSAYHDPVDKLETLSLFGFLNLFNLVKDFIQAKMDQPSRN